MVITPPQINKFFNPQWQWKCGKCESIIGKNHPVCPICEAKRKSAGIIKLRSRTPEELARIRRENALKRELDPPFLLPYKITAKERREVRQKLREKLLKL